MDPSRDSMMHVLGTGSPSGDVRPQAHRSTPSDPLAPVSRHWSQYHQHNRRQIISRCTYPKYSKHSCTHDIVRQSQTTSILPSSAHVQALARKRQCNLDFVSHPSSFDAAQNSSRAHLVQHCAEETKICEVIRDSSSQYYCLGNCLRHAGSGSPRTLRVDQPTLVGDVHVENEERKNNTIVHCTTKGVRMHWP